MVDKKKDKIIIFGNKKNDIIKGTNIFTSIRVFAITTTLQNNSLNIYNIENFKNVDSKILDSKIILSARLLKTDNSTGIKSVGNNVTLITQHQLFNNIKYIYKNNDFSKPKIIFLNNKNINIQKNRYLFKDTPNTNSNNIIKLGNNTISTVNFTAPDTPFLHIGFNFYNLYEKSDYYKIKFNDFLYKDLIQSQIQSQNIYDSNLNTDSIEYTFIDISLNNNFSNNNLINYDENKFKTLFYQVDGSLNNVQILDKPHTIDNSNDNIFIYNQYNNKTNIDICYNVTQRLINYDLKINFEIIKKRNTISPYYGKILIHNDFININGYVLGENTKFFDICINSFDNIKDHSDLSNQNKIFLSLGNGITGITQKNINNSIIFQKNSASINETKIFNNKIIFKNPDVNRPRSSNILNKDYLLDNSYNYNYINTLYFQENTPIDNTTQLFIKKFDISLIDYLNVSDFSNSFNSLEILDNSLNHNHFDISYNNSNIFFKVDNSNDIYLYDNNFEPYNDFSLKIDICGVSPNYENYENIFDFGNSKPDITNKLFYDFRYNYSKQAYFVAYFDIKYQLSGNEIFNTQLNDFSNNLLLNFNKLVITNYFITSTGSDFTNVDCIFVYHDPENTPDLSFRYPNNNIQIIRDVNIDTLSKAIELLPNARTGTSNSIFIPAKNGSNLSRKMIQGLIGMNNIPKLLSIEPYDPNVINNRGFNNQLNFQAGTLSADELKLTDKDKVALKYESQKHSSQKNIVTTSRKNFASLVRQPSRSRNVNLTQTVQNCPTGVSNVNINQYTTPFKLFKTGRGSYLNSGK